MRRTSKRLQKNIVEVKSILFFFYHSLYFFRRSNNMLIGNIILHIIIRTVLHYMAH